MALFVTAIFFHSEFMHTVCLWGGLAISCALVLYDTQLICEKRRRGDNDYVWHTIELFIDFLNLFDYIVSILKEKKVWYFYYCYFVVIYHFIKTFEIWEKFNIYENFTKGKFFLLELLIIKVSFPYFNMIHNSANDL